MRIFDSTRLSQEHLRPSRLGYFCFAFGLFATSPARAWDPSTTHVYITESALRHSHIHRAWMDASEMQLGIFSPLQLDPAKLSAPERAMVEISVQRSQARGNATALGGPHRCPGASAPLQTQQFCVAGDLWEHSAWGWINVGIAIAAQRPAMLIEHVAPPLNAEDKQIPREIRVAQRRRNGGLFATGLSASARLRRNGPQQRATATGPWSFASISESLEASATASDPAQREHELARALIVLGIALHLSQDLTVPANARGDLEAFFSPLSNNPRDRGLGLQEWTRVHVSRKEILTPASTAKYPDFAMSWSSLLTRHDVQKNAQPPTKKPDASVLDYVATHFLSASALPQEVAIDVNLDPKAAAAVLIQGASLHLAPEELAGLELRGWPASAGYLSNQAGRPLAAYRRDETGLVRTFFDERIFDEHAAQLLPLATTLSTAVLNHVWPLATSDDWRDGWVDPRAHLVLDDENGQRRVLRRWEHALPSAAEIAAGQAQAQDGKLPLLVISEHADGELPRLFQWRLGDKKPTSASTSSDAAAIEPSNPSTPAEEAVAPAATDVVDDTPPEANEGADVDTKADANEGPTTPNKGAQEVPKPPVASDSPQ